MLKLNFPQRETLISRAIKEHHTVLDIGCVHNENTNHINGWLHDFLRSLSNNVRGIDIDRRSIEQLREQGYLVEEADAQNFDLGVEFDYIVAGEIIEHIANFEGFLDSIKRHLKKDGKLLITTPNCWNAFNFLSVFFRGSTPIHIQHTCWFCDRTLIQLLERYGYKVLRCEHLVTPKGVRFAIASRILYLFGFKKLAGSGLYVEAQLKG